MASKVIPPEGINSMQNTSNVESHRRQSQRTKVAFRSVPSDRLLIQVDIYLLCLEIFFNAAGT